MRACRRSCSPTRASPVITRTMPGFFSAKTSSISSSLSACLRPSASSAVILLASVKTELSMNSMSPSYICALQAKWRYSAASETSSFSASAAVVILPHFGCSSIWASAFRISSRRSPFTRGMLELYPSVGVAEHQPWQLRDRFDTQVGKRRAPLVAAHPHGGHAEPFRRAQVLRHVVDEGAAVGFEVVRPQQHPEPLQGGLGPVTGALDGVDRVEPARHAERAQHLDHVVARRIGEHQPLAGEAHQRVAERGFADHHAGELRELMCLVDELARVLAVVAHQAAHGGAVALP